MAWRVAESLKTLRKQVDAAVPNRSRANDGTIGDERHQASASDHNPGSQPETYGVVTAMDITHDPARGVDSYKLADVLRQKRDPRIEYVISNRRIFSSTVSPWQWRRYGGSSPHNQHVHISVMHDQHLYDSTKPWDLNELFRKPAPSAPTTTDETFVGVTATVFGGKGNVQQSAYGDRLITDEELCVALPARFEGRRPRVEVTNQSNGKRVVCTIEDVGPWNTNDPYWLTPNARPQAESGKDKQGRKTNLAGIDLSPAAAKAIDLKGKGLVNWRFV